jgi:hypothetical protein
MGESRHMYQMWATRPLNEANFSHLRNENNVNHTHPKSGYFVGPFLYQPYVEAEAFCLDTDEAQRRTTQLRVFVFSETQLPVWSSRKPGHSYVFNTSVHRVCSKQSRQASQLERRRSPMDS